MTKKTIQHIYHYMPLIGILAVGVLGFYIFAYDRIFQIFISVALAVSYLVWGIVHHYIHKDLHLSVVIEYIIVASLGLVAVLSIISSAM